jgi:WD40 repeat protein
VKLWEADNERKVVSLNGHTNFVTSVAFRPDGKRLATCSGDQANPWLPGEVIVWDTEKHRQVLAFKGQLFQSLAVSNDGRSLISGGIKANAPHNQRIGEVKLYSLSQLEERGAPGPR